MEVEQLWQQTREFLVMMVTYVFPVIAVIVSVFSYVDSRKTNKLQERLMQVEDKLKLYELEDKEKEREESTKASVEARIVKISKETYKMKIYNNGKATAYQVEFKVPEGYERMVLRDKVPYEFLDPNKSFEEHVLVYDGTPSKFMVTTTWTDQNDTSYTKDQIVSI
jgi:hypothetical protein